MIHLIVLATALLRLQDPVGDAVGDGSLAPPTAPVYANTADFDLQSVSVMDDPKLTVRVTLGSISNPGHLPNGFSSPIIEVYLDTGSGGSNALLPGSGMRMPPKHGWNVALRATGDQVYAVTPRAQGDPGSWPHLPASVEVQGNALLIHTDLPRPAHAEIYALTGVYDPFASDAWRPLTTSVSPWAFSSDTQRVPVVDLLASNQRAQRREIDSETLSPYRPRTYGMGWLLLMVAGVIIAAAGAILRRRVPLARRPLALPAPQEREEKRRLPPFWGGMPPIERSFFDELEDASLWSEAYAGAGRAGAEPVSRLDGAGPPNAGGELVDGGGPAGAAEPAAGGEHPSNREEPASGAASQEAEETGVDGVPAPGAEAAGEGEVPDAEPEVSGVAMGGETASGEAPVSGVDAAGDGGVASDDEDVARRDAVAPGVEAADDEDVASDDGDVASEVEDVASDDGDVARRDAVAPGVEAADDEDVASDDGDVASEVEDVASEDEDVARRDAVAPGVEAVNDEDVASRDEDVASEDEEVPRRDAVAPGVEAVNDEDVASEDEAVARADVSMSGVAAADDEGVASLDEEVASDGEKVPDAGPEAPDGAAGGSEQAPEEGGASKRKR